MLHISKLLILTPFFLVADTQLYKRLCPSVGPSVRDDRVEKWKIERFGYF